MASPLFLLSPRVIPRPVVGGCDHRRSERFLHSGAPLDELARNTAYKENGNYSWRPDIHSAGMLTSDARNLTADLQLCDS